VKYSCEIPSLKLLRQPKTEWQPHNPRALASLEMATGTTTSDIFLHIHSRFTIACMLDMQGTQTASML
jgi:hypothetical protein